MHRALRSFAPLVLLAGMHSAIATAGAPAALPAADRILRVAVPSPGPQQTFLIATLNALGAEPGYAVAFVPVEDTDQWNDYLRNNVVDVATNASIDVALNRIDASARGFYNPLEPGEMSTTRRTVTIPLAAVSEGLVVRSDSPVTGWADLAGAAVGYNGPYNYTTYIRRSEHLFESIKFYVSYAALVAAVRSGEVAAGLATAEMIRDFVLPSPDLRLISRPALQPEIVEGLHLALRAQDQALLAELNAGIATLEANGTLARLRVAGALDPPPLVLPPHALKNAGGPLADDMRSDLECDLRWGIDGTIRIGENWYHIPWSRPPIAFSDQEDAHPDRLQVARGFIRAVDLGMLETTGDPEGLLEIIISTSPPPDIIYEFSGFPPGLPRQIRGQVADLWVWTSNRVSDPGWDRDHAAIAARLTALLEQSRVAPPVPLPAPLGCPKLRPLAAGEIVDIGGDRYDFGRLGLEAVDVWARGEMVMAVRIRVPSTLLGYPAAVGFPTAGAFDAVILPERNIQTHDDPTGFGPVFYEGDVNVFYRTAAIRFLRPRPTGYGFDPDTIPPDEIIAAPLLALIDGAHLDGAPLDEIGPPVMVRPGDEPAAAPPPICVPSPPTADRLIALAAYEGAAMSTVTVAGQDDVTHVIRVNVEPGTESLSLFLATTGPVIWLIEGDTARIAQVFAHSEADAADPAGIPATGVVGLPEATELIFVRAADCPPALQNVFERTGEAAVPALTTILGRAPDAFLGEYDPTLINVPSLTLPAFAGPMPVSPPGLDSRLWRSFLRFNPSGLVTIDPADVRSAAVVEAYNVLPQEAGLAQLMADGTLQILASGDEFQILRPMHFPAGLAGAHQVTFILPPGLPFPSGYVGHSCVYDEVTGIALAAPGDQQAAARNDMLCPRR